MPVSVIATASGGSQAVSSGPRVDYSLKGGTWTQVPGEVDLIVAGAEATLRYDGVTAPPLCTVVLELFLNGEPLDSIQFNNPSTAAQHLDRRFTSGLVDQRASTTNTLTAKVFGVSGCTESSIESVRVEVIGVG